MRLLIGEDARIGRYVADHAPLERPVWAGGFTGFGILRSDGELVAGVVFSDWHPAEKRLEFSACADDPRAFTTRIIVALGDYAFGQVKAYRVWARTSKDNTRALKFLEGVGFIREGTLASWYGPEKHAVILRVTAPEWQRKWGPKLLKAA